MTTQRTISAILLACIVLLAGCPGVEPGDQTSVTFLGEMNATDSGFEMNGQLVQTPGTAGFQSYDDVALKLYTANGALIHSRQLGTLEQELNISVSVSEVPEYVVFTSPDFWERDNTAVSYFEHGEDIYINHMVTSRHELPVDVTDSSS